MRRLGGLLAVLLATGACGPGSDEGALAPGPEAAPSGAAAAAVAPAARPARIPDGGVNGGDSARGAQLYAQYCAACHGPQGKGDGPLSITLFPRPADHTDAARIGSLSDEILYLGIEQGGTAVGKSPLMTGWGAVLAPQDILDLIAHIRVISGT